MLAIVVSTGNDGIHSFGKAQGCDEVTIIYLPGKCFTIMSQ